MKRLYIILEYQVVTVVKDTNEVVCSSFVIFKKQAKKMAEANYKTNTASATYIVNHKTKHIEWRYGGMIRMNSASRAMQKKFPESEGWNNIIANLQGEQI